MLVGSRMTAQLYTVAPSATIGQALELTRSQRIRHLPVVEQEQLVGVVTERELRLAAPPAWHDDPQAMRAALATRTVSEVMIRDVITTQSVVPIEEAAKQMYENRIGCLPVLNAENRLVGILTRTDLLRALVELFGATNPLARIEVRMPNRAGELARVVRVIGIEHKVNISGLIAPPTGHAHYSEAIVQLQTPDPLPIIEGLRKLGYKVGWPAIELDPDSDTDGLGHATNELPARNRVPVEI